MQKKNSTSQKNEWAHFESAMDILAKTPPQPKTPRKKSPKKKAKKAK